MKRQFWLDDYRHALLLLALLVLLSCGHIAHIVMAVTR